MKRSPEELHEELETIRESWIDGKLRMVNDSRAVQSDGETWGIVSDHGNVELCHKGRNGRIYYHGGIV